MSGTETSIGSNTGSSRLQTIINEVETTLRGIYNDRFLGFGSLSYVLSWSTKMASNRLIKRM